LDSIATQSGNRTKPTTKSLIAVHFTIQSRGKMMTRQSIRAGALVFALLLIQGACAQAQWGYPVGYGGYGWGGWGGGGQTPQGDIARGLGAYAMGAGYYNQQTAVANSINADTVMRWNQYVYESQMNANRLRAARLAADRSQTNQAADQIRERLRNNPERADIYRGDALNAALDEINDPRVYSKTLQGGQVKIGGEMIRNIPFQSASAAITMSIHQLVKGGPPKALLKPEFAADREAIRALGQEIRKQIDDDKAPDKATIGKMLAAINQAEANVDKLLPKNTKDRNEADRYLKALHGLIAMLDTPALDLLLAGVDKRPDATLGELLGFMNAFNLRFGPATTPKQREVYDSLYPKLVDLRNQIAPALAATSPAPASGTEPGEFFSGMDYKDLQKRAPTPPPPAPSDKK
jgi:soluble cytochrome b562